MLKFSISILKQCRTVLKNDLFKKKFVFVERNDEDKILKIKKNF